MSERFFVESPVTGSTASLVGQEASHLTKVLRAKIGHELVLFDGSGREFAARIVELERHAVHCEILETREISREALCQLTLATPLPKGDRQRFLIEKLTELGVATLVPLITARSVVQPDGGVVERLRRYVVEASKQCGRNRLLEISPPAPLSTWLTAQTGPWRFLAHPVADGTGDVDWRELAADVSRPISVCVGPEGGFTAEEVETAVAAGWRCVNLGSRILRMETAALALAAKILV